MSHRVKITTKNDVVVYGKVHSYLPHSLITIIKTSPSHNKQSTQAQQDFASADNTYTHDATLISINVDHIANISSYGKPKQREDYEINKKFAMKVNAPHHIPTDLLAMNIRKGSKVITRQETEFKLRKIIKGKKVSDEGVKLLRHLAAHHPIDTILLDESGNIKFSDSDIKIMKPFKSTDVKIIDGKGTKQEEEHLNNTKNIIDKAWEKIEQTRKGG